MRQRISTSFQGPFVRHQQRQLLLGASLVVVVVVGAAPSVKAQQQQQQPRPHDMCTTDAQCLNGGRCVLSQSNGQLKSVAVAATSDDDFNHCACRPSFGGSRCEHFCRLQCQNAGVCYRRSSSSGSAEQTQQDPVAHPFSVAYACKCLGYWTGTVCEVPYQNCGSGVQCYNGGICRSQQQQQQQEQMSGNSTSTAITTTNDYDRSNCDCPPPFSGPTCQDVAVAGAAAVKTALDGRNTILVAVSVLLGSFLLTGLALFCVRRQRRRKLDASSSAAAAYNVVGMSDDDGFDKNNNYNHHFELEISNRGENPRMQHHSEDSTIRFKIIV
jgi:hypothetical protein